MSSVAKAQDLPIDQGGSSPQIVSDTPPKIAVWTLTSCPKETLTALEKVNEIMNKFYADNNLTFFTANRLKKDELGYLKCLVPHIRNDRQLENFGNYLLVANGKQIPVKVLPKDSKHEVPNQYTSMVAKTLGIFIITIAIIALIKRF